MEIRKKLEDARFIDDIVHAFMEFQTAENTVIPHLKQSLAELNKSIDNILAAIEQGIFTQSTKQRLEELESKKKDVEIEIAKESIRRPLLNEDQVRFWFERLRNLNINELSHRKRLIDTFLNSVFVYDDKLLINCNYPNTSTIVRFSDINATLNGSDILACGRPAGSTGSQISGVGIRNPNFITRRWSSDLFLFPATSGKLPLPIIEGVRHKFLPSHTTAKFGY